jgi:hydroxymethylbilane synthase
MRLRILSRASALAVLQADLVARALQSRWPGLDVVRMTRTSEGDRDRSLDLWSAAAKGVFTADLSQQLVTDEADLVVHSWKDLPIEPYAGTMVAATLERADARDVLLVRLDVVRRRPAALNVLSSSPRRAWQLTTSLAPLLPWATGELRMLPVRGNIPTRLNKLLAGDGDALVVAKAALDRLLSEDAAPNTRAAVRTALDACRWMALPLKAFPTAPAQGALAIEVAAHRADVVEAVRAVNHESTWRAVERERAVLQSFGGGCHEAVGATVLIREYGTIESVRARTAAGVEATRWSLESTTTAPPPVTSTAQIWPRPDERDRATRRPLAVPMPAAIDGLWVARADAWPADHEQTTEFVWAAGDRTWQRLAERGIWVSGSADGLGDAEPANIDALAGHAVVWRRLTHATAGDPDALATYAVDLNAPDDLASRTHFFWTSGSAFLAVLGAHPELRTAWHASGPGRTSSVIRETLGTADNVSVWLDYDQWHHHVTQCLR